jgi:Flp pilus assembly protein TadG
VRARAKGGSAALVLLVVLTVLFAVAALAVDLGYAHLVQAQLQVGADSAALAGVRALNRTTRGMVNARAAAVELAGLNDAGGAAVHVDPNTANAAGGDVVLGMWNGTTFTPSSDPTKVDSVSVTVRVDTPASALAQLAYGQDTVPVSTRSIAVQGIRLGASEVPYYLPFALPKCLMENWSKTALAQMTFVLNPATADNVGWALLSGSPSTSSLTAHITAMLPCMTAWFQTGDITGSCESASLGATAYLGNGDMQSALRTLADSFSQGVPWESTVWGALPARHSGSGVSTTNYGKMLAGPLPIFDGGSGYCSGSDSWTGNARVTGFVWAAIYDVKHSGSAADRNVWLKIDPITYRDIGVWYGGPDYGLTYVGPAVVVR